MPIRYGNAVCVWWGGVGWGEGNNLTFVLNYLYSAAELNPECTANTIYELWTMDSVPLGSMAASINNPRQVY